MPARQIQVAVVGSASADHALLSVAEDVGKKIALAGALLVCGGLTGVMEAAAKGARSGGGTVLGVLPGYAHCQANQWVDIVVPTGLGHARNAVVVASGEAVIALAGGAGTLSEVYLALKLGRPVVVLGNWVRPQGALHAQTPGEAVSKALSALTPSRR